MLAWSLWCIVWLLTVYFDGPHVVSHPVGGLHIFFLVEGGLVMWLAPANKIRVEVVCGTSNRSLYNHLMVCLIFFLPAAESYVASESVQSFLGPRVKLTGADPWPTSNGYIAQRRNKPLFSLRFWNCCYC